MKNFVESIPQFRRGRRRLLIDLVIGLLIFGITWILYTSDLNPYRKNWAKSSFYERYYGVVVLSICEGRWQTPRPGQSKALDDFLAQRRDRIDCTELPSAIAVSPTLNYQAVNYYYLFKTVEFAWRLRGEISWSGLDGLLGLFCAWVSVCVYMIFRLGMGRLLSLAAVILYLPAHIVWVPRLRDYGKAPFFLLILWCLGFLVHSRYLSVRRLMVTSILMGLVFGVGMGYRQDILITLPAVALTFAVFLPWRWSSRWRIRLLALALAVVAASLAYWPVARFDKRVHTNTHVMLLGLADRFDKDLALDDSVYHWTHIVSDPWVVFQIKSLSRYGLGRKEVVQIYGKEYSRLGGLLLREILLRHPADFLIRAYAASSQLLYIPWVFLGLLTLVVARAPRRGLFLSFVALYFTAYTAIQFHPRHYFHMEWAPIWLIGFGFQSSLVPLGGRAWRAWRGREQGRKSLWKRPDRLQVRRALMFLVAGPLALGVPLFLARTYQTRAVERWLEEYEHADLEPLEGRIEPIEDGKVRLVPGEFLERLPTKPAYQYDIGYLAVDLDLERCDMTSVRVTVRYEPGAYHDFSHVLEAADNMPRRFFVPIYSRVRVSYGDSVFLGLEMSPSAIGCVAVQRVRDMGRLPPIPRIELTADWHERPLYQRYSGPPGFAGLRSWIAREVFRLRRMAAGLRTADNTTRTEAHGPQVGQDRLALK